ncbi:glucose-6-phosphate exchanger SLC37A2-like [Oppia nitens]|uniref:glucose-6-phosphate exchanger SLC37A2-like n=1 Tax=Oppia nitens TaxID=1686743 RepID=UPI0023DBF385|nr:glucose-6-phosphate exchanger SLC37A2-like [Oppia nitens]
MVFRRPLSICLVSKLSHYFSLKELRVYRVLVLMLTFFVYLTYHMSRRSLSIVKPALNHKNCSDILPDMYDSNNTDIDEHWCDWAPFSSRTMLGTLDLVFLISYSVSMYINGMIAERMNLRYFLTIGMLFSGICNILFGLAYFLGIHSLGYFYFVQIITGIGQSTGWPGVLAAVGNWFGSSKRGLMFGIWNSHLYFGNIAGAAIAGLFVDDKWGMSFIVPGIIIAGTGILVFLFLVQKPEEVSLSLNSNAEQTPVKANDKLKTQIQFSSSSDVESDQLNNHKAISIIDALKIPGVIEFSICLFFAKLVSYTFLDWLPLYIVSSNEGISSSKSAYMTIVFDVGGIAGGIIAGYLADRTGASALCCIVMLIFAIPSLGIYRLYGNTSEVVNEILQFIAGIFVNAPYALITTAVSAELGSKVPSKSAMATVSAIIDATGSIGSAVGPSLAGFVSEYDWNYVFIVVMLSDLCALLVLIRVGYNDIKQLIFKWRTHRTRNSNSMNQDIISVTTY